MFPKALIPALPGALNEAFGWLWVLLGMLTGAVLGMFFNRDGFLGGYAARPRRLIRLGHISFVGLGLLNILFAASLPRASGALGERWAFTASAAMVIGGISMPTCCGLAAWRARFQPLFAVPVLSLTFAVEILLVGLVQQ
jgi:hypothetical protein